MSSIQRRLNLIYGTIILSTFIMLGLLLLIPLENYFLRQMEDNLAPQVRMSARLFLPYLNNSDYPALRNLVHNVGKENNVRVTVVDEDGQVIADSEHDYKTMSNHLNRVEIQRARKAEFGYSIRMSDTLKEKMLYCASRISNSSSRKFYIRVAVSLWRIDSMYDYLKKLLFGVLSVIAALALVAGFKTAKSITVPIDRLKNVAQKLAEGELQTRTEAMGDNELAVLSNTLNNMAEKLQLLIKKTNSEKEQLETIFEHLGAGVVVINSSGQIELHNTTSDKMFNISRRLTGKPLNYMIRDAGFEKAFNTTHQLGEAQDYEFKYLELFLRAHFVPLTDGHDNKVVVLIYDVTPLKQWQQVRSDFVANASHELRTPLTAIKGYTETLLDGALEDKDIAKSFLEIIDKESDRLTRIVEDLLDLSKLERKATLKKQNFALINLVEEVKQNFSAKLIERGLKFNNKVQGNFEVFADIDWLEQVFVNLIDNAIKYSKANGEIVVESNQTEENVVIDVKDNGIGIPYQDLPRIFERFYRVDKSRSRSMGGTGLGLAIVKHIIESHGGTVSVDSTLGAGTTITFTLPKKLT